MRWVDLPAHELTEFSRKNDTALIPVGYLEPHGPHLPIGTDSFIAEKLADKIAEKEECIVLPTIYYNTNPHQRTNPGTVALPPADMVSQYKGICDSVADNGLSRKIPK